MTLASAFQLVRDNYSTYRNEQNDAVESHFTRIIVQVSIAALITVSVSSLSDDSISVLVTALSILIGFAFAAMFPIALESVAGLPKPIYAEDRDDIKVIRQLAAYFRFNVAYFIPLALICVISLLVQMLEFRVPSFLLSVHTEPITSLKEMANRAYGVGTALKLFILACSIFLLQECCYTFYRMCFNALALLRIKEEYIANRPDI